MNSGFSCYKIKLIFHTSLLVVAMVVKGKLRTSLPNENVCKILSSFKSCNEDIDCKEFKVSQQTKLCFLLETKTCKKTILHIVWYLERNIRYTCNLGKSHFHLFQFAAHSILGGSMSEWHNFALTWHTPVLSVNLPRHPSALLCCHGAAPVTAQGIGKLHVPGKRASTRLGRPYSHCGVVSLCLLAHGKKCVNILNAACLSASFCLWAKSD